MAIAIDNGDDDDNDDDENKHTYKLFTLMCVARTMFEIQVFAQSTYDSGIYFWKVSPNSACMEGTFTFDSFRISSSSSSSPSFAIYAYI